MSKFAVLLSLASVVLAQESAWEQCGGIGWNHTECTPGVSPSSAPPTSASSLSQSDFSASPLPRLGGVNTAGYDFTVNNTGHFQGTPATPPAFQFSHFTAERVNIYRIPFAWQLMTPAVGGPIDQKFLSGYDQTVQAALSSGQNVYVIIDLHNYARWNGGIIAQGGPTDAQFQNIWTQLAQKYGSNNRIIFGIMNEPHDLDVSTWVNSVQGVVKAVRGAGSQNYLLLPGSTFSSADAFPNEAGPLLVKVTDPLGGTSKLIFDVHKYLDFDNTGTHRECNTDNIPVFQKLVQFLQQNGNRQAILTETGGGNTPSCETMLKNELAFVKQSYPTLIGFTAWSAGAFDTKYNLTLTPNPDGSDQPLWNDAVKPNLP